MSRLARDGTAEPVSRDRIIRRERGQENVHFPCSVDHEQDWQPYPKDIKTMVIHWIKQYNICREHYQSTDFTTNIQLFVVCLYVKQPIVLFTILAVAADSNIQRIVLVTEETTRAQISHRSIKCQSRSWSQRGTKVNGSHHGDNPLLKPTGISIAT